MIRLKSEKNRARISNPRRTLEAQIEKMLAGEHRDTQKDKERLRD